MTLPIQEPNLINPKRQPSETVYNIFLTIILAIVIVLIIYYFVPYSHYNIYIIEPKS